MLNQKGLQLRLVFKVPFSISVGALVEGEEVRTFICQKGKGIVSDTFHIGSSDKEDVVGGHLSRRCCGERRQR